MTNKSKNKIGQFEKKITRDSFTRINCNLFYLHSSLDKSQYKDCMIYLLHATFKEYHVFLNPEC